MLHCVIISNHVCSFFICGIERDLRICSSLLFVFRQDFCVFNNNDSCLIKVREPHLYYIDTKIVVAVSDGLM